MKLNEMAQVWQTLKRHMEKRDKIISEVEKKVRVILSFLRKRPTKDIVEKR